MKVSASIIGLAVVLAACGKGESSAPTGQVAATAAGHEITTSQLRTEIGTQVSGRNALSQQPAALQAIINRKLLAEASIERGLDKSPLAAVVLDKARDLALIALLEQDIRSKAPKVSQSEANTYVQDNPLAFSQRSIHEVDQLMIPAISPALVRRMEPLTTLEQITALLEQNKVPFRTGTGSIDPLTLEPAVAGQIANLDIGSVFVTSQGGSAQVSRIRSRTPAPITGNEASSIALRVLSERRIRGLLNDQFQAIAEAGKSTVKINPAFAPKAAAPARS